MSYEEQIAEILKTERIRAVSPRHIEAWMRSEHATLDGLSVSAFRRDVIEFAQMIAHYKTEELSERLAKSFGL